MSMWLQGSVRARKGGHAMPTILTDDMPTEVEEEDIRALVEVGAIEPTTEPDVYRPLWCDEDIVRWLEENTRWP